MNTASREIGHRLLDVLICLVLFVLACAFAGAIQRYIFPNTDWLDIVWFSIGMLPVIFYARYRGVCRFDKWDIVAYSPLPFVLMSWRLARTCWQKPLKLLILLTPGAFPAASGSRTCSECLKSGDSDYQ